MPRNTAKAEKLICIYAPVTRKRPILARAATCAYIHETCRKNTVAHPAVRLMPDHNPSLEGIL